MMFQLNLAEKPYVNRRSLRMWLLFAGGALSLVLLLNLVYGYQNYLQYQQVGAHLEELDVRLASRQGVSGFPVTPEALELVSRQLAAAETIIAADRFRWTRLLGRLEELAPARVAVRSLRPDFKSHSLQISAVARDLRDMTAFLDALLESPDLAKVSLAGHSEKEEKSSQGRPESVIQFTLSIEEAF